MFTEMRQHILIISILLQSSCAQDDGGIVTELEGSWATGCLSSFVSFSNPAGKTRKIITTYKGSSIATVVNTYTDKNCAQLESSVEASESDIFVNPDDIQISFTIGDTTISSNGVAVREIDFVTVGDKTQFNIYLLQDDGSTLYFGLPCSLNPAACLNNRPAEISYVSPYIKVF